MGLNFLNTITQSIYSSFIEPLRDFRQKVAPLNTTHNESLSNLEKNVNALLTGSDGQPAFQGAAAQQLGNLVSEFVRNERKLSGTSSDPLGYDLTGRLGDASDRNRYWAEWLATYLDSLRVYAQTQDPSSSKGIQGFIAGVGVTAGALDTGAEIQLGLDVPWDILAIGTSVLYLGMLLIQAEAPEAAAAFTELCQVVPKIKQDYQTIEHNDPLTPETPLSKGPKPTPGSQPEPWPWPWDPIPPLPKDDPDCYLRLLQVKSRFPGVSADVIHYLVCLQPPMDPQQVIQLFQYWTTHGMSEQDINDLINRLRNLRVQGNQPTRDQIIRFITLHFQDVPDIWAKYQTVQNIPGIDQVLKDMITPPPNSDSSDSSGYRGYYFELKWVANRQQTQGDVWQVEMFVGNRHGADVVLSNGTLVDTKEDIWQNQTPFFRNVIYVRSLTQQLENYRTNPAFAGRPVVFVFDSNGGRLPAAIQQVFDHERSLGLNVTVEYWPNSNPPQIVP